MRIFFITLIIITIIALDSFAQDDKNIPEKDITSHPQKNIEALSSNFPANVRKEIDLLHMQYQSIIKDLKVANDKADAYLDTANKVINYSTFVFTAIASVFALFTVLTLVKVKEVQKDVQKVKDSSSTIIEIEKKVKESQGIVKIHEKIITDKSNNFYEWLFGLEEGTQAFKSGNFQKAIDCFRFVCEFNPMPAACVYYIYSLLSLNLLNDDTSSKEPDLNLALEIADKLEKLQYEKMFSNQNPKYSSKILKIMIYTRLNNMEDAEKSYNKAIKIDSSRPDAYSQMGIAYMFAGKLEDACTKLKEAIEKSEDLKIEDKTADLIGPFILGCLLYKNDNIDDSKKKFSLSLSRAMQKIKKDDSLISYLMLGLSIISTGKRNTLYLTLMNISKSELQNKLNGFHQLPFLLKALDLFNNKKEFPCGMKISEAKSFLKPFEEIVTSGNSYKKGPLNEELIAFWKDNKADTDELWI